MILTKKNIVEKLMMDDVIHQSYIYSYKSKKYWKLTKPIKVIVKGNLIEIPEGFTYDMATVPKWLWSFIRPYNDALFSTLIHDYLYIYKHNHNMTRYEVDREFLDWSNILNNNKFDNYVRYLFVRLFGWLWWYDIV